MEEHQRVDGCLAGQTVAQRGGQIGHLGWIDRQLAVEPVPHLIGPITRLLPAGQQINQLRVSEVEKGSWLIHEMSIAQGPGGVNLIPTHQFPELLQVYGIIQRQIQRRSKSVPIIQPYPFTAIVGQDRMKRALILNAITSGIGGVLIRGERGTAKSTAARALAALLPEIEVVTDCPFACDPSGLDTLCDNCRDRLARGEVLPTTRRRTRFVDLPVSATEDRVVGTLDIEKAIQQGERHFEPGVQAAANRGLLYVDEVNLLDDHVVDLLLDSAAMGVNVVEREGISFSHPAHFILVGTMNPEEGDLRPQLLDRFALCVDMHGLANPRQRVAIVERRIAYEQDPEGFYQEWLPREEQLSQKIAEARDSLPLVKYTQRDLFTIAELTNSFKVDGHRADIVILKAARAQAAWAGRSTIGEQDILLAAELALPHRLKRQPFEEAVMDTGQLEERLRKARADAPPDMPPPQDAEDGTASVKKVFSR